MNNGTICIIGASRGIGLGLVREFAERGWQVFASQRAHSDELAAAAEQAQGRVTIVEADVTDERTIEALKSRLEGTMLDVLVLNAGVYGPRDQSIDAMGREDVAEILMTNAVGPVRTALALLPRMRDGGTIGMMTSKMGSIEDSSGGSNHYRVSKVAQNMFARSLFENHAKAHGIRVLSLHPGWVQTDMGGSNALISVEQSVRGLAERLLEEGPPRHEFVAFDGQRIGW